MPGFLYHAGALAACPHGGQITVTPTNVRVMVSGMPVATMSDQTVIAGCAFTVPPGVSQPCLRVQWTVPSARVKINGIPALVQVSQGLCLGPTQAPQGPALITGPQTRVAAL